MTRRNVRKQGWVFPLFSPASDYRLSLNFHRFVILYISCDTRSVGLWTILFTESVQWLEIKLNYYYIFRSLNKVKTNQSNVSDTRAPKTIWQIDFQGTFIPVPSFSDRVQITISYILLDHAEMVVITIRNNTASIHHLSHTTLEHPTILFTPHQVFLSKALISYLDGN